MPSIPREGMSPSGRTSPSKAHSTCYGQVIEYIRDRIYLASYTHPPNEHTPFPYPSRSSPKSPTKRGSRVLGRYAANSVSTSAPRSPPVYFTMDNELLYNAFHADFGPLHIGHLYRFALRLHEVIGLPENEGRGIVFWTAADARRRANAACILACYMVLLQHWPPHLALAPISQMDPPPMGFRDAGYSQADYVLNIQDVVYGVWRAKEEGLCDLAKFSLEEYERFERVENGDFNWISPNFLAFASPQSEIITPIHPSDVEYATLPTSVDQIQATPKINQSFKNVLTHFASRDIGLVVRLNSELYSPTYFTTLGIQHLDMIFDDGTCPQLPLVRRFIRLAHDMITKHKRHIAVHCKAGLGRTGCLIGAYLIYRHGFTANELIAYMRFMRPGMVVGPQQHWLHLNQGTFREWWFEDQLKEKLAHLQPATPPRGSLRSSRLASHGPTSTPPQKRPALEEIDSNEQVGALDDSMLPAPTPGQPRKTSRAILSRRGSARPGMENDETYVRPDTEIVSMERHTHNDNTDEEEWSLKVLRHNSSRSPADKRRTVSCTSTMTMVTSVTGVAEESDIENRDVPGASPVGGKVRAGARRSPSGKGDISVGKTRSVTTGGTGRRRSGESAAAVKGVRKTSGRVGSVGNGTQKLK